MYFSIGFVPWLEKVILGVLPDLLSQVRGDQMSAAKIYK